MRTLHAFLAMVAIAMFVTVSTASAQAAGGNDQPPCIIINGVKCYVQYDPCGHVISINCPGGSSGTAQFTLIPPGDPCAAADNTDLDPSKGTPLNAILVPKTINVNVQDNAFGQITTTLDDSRTPNYTTIVTTDEARAAGEVYPLAVRIKFYAQATLAAQPDTKLVSQTELVFGSDNVNSVSPFSNETFTLLNDVNYYEQGDAKQTTVFTLQAGSTNLTINGQEDQGRHDLH